MLDQNAGDLPGGAGSPDDGGRRGGGGGGRGGGGRGGGRGGGGRGPGGGEEEMGRRASAMDFVRTQTEASKQLTVVVHDDSVNITDAEGQVLVLATGGGKVQERAGNGLIKVSKTAHWDGPTLIAETDVDGGPKIVHKYALSPGGTQLTVTTTVEGGGRPTSLMRIYERPLE